ncbi:MAG TPA: YggS family pyridoxal phosphate-dependent enzyme [Frankiaceae bacterium]|nr:YggS family pyridoxal phosphate-dependent enzyme [Frankiaceae bacterium]
MNHGSASRAGVDAAADNLGRVEQRVVAAASAAGRHREDLTLIAVSKTRPPGDVLALARLGVRDFGESRWQELAPKIDAVLALDAGPDGVAPGLRWHFLGRLQRNKARAVAAAIGTVHSLDRAELCAPLSRGAAAADRILDAFVQVTLDGDPTRGGVAPEDLPALADAVAAAPALRLVGLMAVAPLGAPARPAFARLRRLSERLRVDHPEAWSISAGMSGDLEDAVAEGATHLRVGTALFGSRA